MVKRKYLATILIPTIIFYSANISASAWLPEPGRYKASLSYNQLDYISEKYQQKRVDAYRRGENLITEGINLRRVLNEQRLEIINLILENYEVKSIADIEKSSEKIHEATAEVNREISKVNKEIHKTIRILNQLTSYQDKFSSTAKLEYGIDKTKSFGVSIVYKHNHFFSSKYTKNDSATDNGEVFGKYKFFQNKHFVISIQPKLYVERNTGYGQQFFQEISLLAGITYKGKHGQVFTEGGLSVGGCINNSCGKKKYTSFALSEGVKLPYGLMIVNFSKYYWRRNYGEIYNKTIYEQFSIAKEINFGNLRRNKFTMQLGYFWDRSVIKSYYRVSGTVFSVWLDV